MGKKHGEGARGDVRGEECVIASALLHKGRQEVFVLGPQTTGFRFASCGPARTCISVTGPD